MPKFGAMKRVRVLKNLKSLTLFLAHVSIKLRDYVIFGLSKKKCFHIFISLRYISLRLLLLLQLNKYILFSFHYAVFGHQPVIEAMQFTVITAATELQ